MQIGAHVSTHGGLFGAIHSAQEIGADAAQIWGSNPRAWRPPSVGPDGARAFGDAWREAGLGPLFLHAPYMVNVASPNPDFRRRSVNLARATVALAEGIGAVGVVVHAGAAGRTTPRETALRTAADSFVAIASDASSTFVLIELMAGGAGMVASDFGEAGELFDACSRHPRLGLCADTCHLFAAGYALDTAAGVGEAFAELRRYRLGTRLKLVHANDSKYPRGMRRDSHEHIGEGFIGEDGFRAILRHPAVRRCAVVCETRGGVEEHARDVATLKRLARPAR